MQKLSPNWSRVALPEDWESAGFGLYVHWPFCQAKCPYCDFNSHVADHIDQSRWLAAYLSEIDRVGKLTSGRILRTMFFGGGTPSLMEPRIVDAIVSKARATWSTSNEIEVTLEANPTSVEADRFSGYRDAGVNRISMGIQALSDTDLKSLGRLHSVDEALSAFEIARSQFDRVSFDLIYARQDQTLAAWEDELRLALSLAVDHLSLYQLTVEDGTAFGARHKIGRLRGLPSDDVSADMYLITQDICKSLGFPGYEVSNHARSGRECQHNLIYWRSGDYAGIGPGAHGRLTLHGQRIGTESVRQPGKWLAAVERAHDGTLTREVLSRENQMTEFLLMGLRLKAGIDRKRFDTMTDGRLEQKVLNMQDEGWLICDGERIAVSDRGRPVLNGVLRMLLADH